MTSSYYAKNVLTPVSPYYVYGQSAAAYFPAVLTKPITFNTSTLWSENYGFAGSYEIGPPNWRSLIEQGAQAGTHMTCVKTVLKRTDVKTKGFSLYIFSKYKRSEGYWYGLFPSTWWAGSLASAASPSSESSANSKALQSFIKNARRSTTQVQGGVIGGEIMKTVRQIRHPAKTFYYSLRRYLRVVKDRRWYTKYKLDRSYNSLNRVLSDTWLEYSYGWAPLVSDIDDAARYLAQQLALDSQRHERVLVTGKGVDENVAPNQGHHSVSFGGAKLQWTKSATHRTTVMYKGLLGNTTTYRDLSWKVPRDLGFGLSNFAPTVWELIPYSFLIDYFTNLGDVISAISFPRSNFRWIMRWVVTEDERSLVKPTPVLGNDPSGGAEYAIGGPCSRTEKTIYREPYYGSLVPDFRFEIPGLSMKWLNLAALAGARLF